MNAGLTSALLILVVYAQAATHGTRLTARMLGALLVSALAGAVVTLVCADALLRPSALMHLLWLVAAVTAGSLASGFSAYFGVVQADAARASACQDAPQTSALWRLCVCTNFCVLLIALPDPFMQITPVQPDLAAGCSAAAAGTAVVGCALLLIASALHTADHARPTAVHAFLTVAVLCIVIAGLAAWLPDGPMADVRLPEMTRPVMALGVSSDLSAAP